MISGFSEYQHRAGQTAVYPSKNTGNIEALSYVTLGLVGEAGEIANKVKKILRDGDGIVTDENRAVLRDEVGDVLWYVARLAQELDCDLTDIADDNISKLFSRKERGVLQGSGDNR